MGFKSIADLDCDVAYALGGVNKETGKPNPKTAEGYYIGFKVTDGKYGPGKLYILQTESGNIGIFGKTNLDQKMTAVTPGVMVRISLNGTVPTNKGNDMIKFKVEVDEDNTIEVNTAPNATETTFEEANNEETYQEQDDLEETEEAIAPVAKAPARAASAPDAARQKKVQELLGRSRKGAAA